MLTFDSTKRLNTRLDELYSRLEGVLATLHRLETEWMDTKDQVRKSYQRLEAAGQRAARKAEVPGPAPEQVLPLQANLDPYSRKLLAVRGQTNADAPGTDESAG